MPLFGRIRSLHVACVALTLGLFPLVLAGAAPAAESHAIAMHGAPAMPADFPHMPYANPAAPKGGRLVESMLGTFDSLNPLIVRGAAVQQIRGLPFERGLVLESLMVGGGNEDVSLFVLLSHKQPERE